MVIGLSKMMQPLDVYVTKNGGTESTEDSDGTTVRKGRNGESTICLRRHCGDCIISDCALIDRLNEVLSITVTRPVFIRRLLVRRSRRAVAGKLATLGGRATQRHHGSTFYCVSVCPSLVSEETRASSTRGTSWRYGVRLWLTMTLWVT